MRLRVSKLALYYLVVGAIWIGTSDKILSTLYPEHFSTISLYKGWAFIVLTFFMLNWLLLLENKRRDTVEHALRESEARFKLLVTHAPAALALFDREMCYLAVSRRWLDDYKLARTDIVGRSYYQIFPEIPEAWKEVHRRSLAGDKVREEDDRFERHDAPVPWVCWEALPWHDSVGNIGGIVIFSEDITERKHAVEALEESENRFRIVSSLTTDVIYSCHRSDNEAFHIDWVGGQTERVFGYTINEIKSFGCWRPFVLPEDLPMFAKSITDLQPGQSSDSVIRIKHKNGDLRYLHSIASVIGDPRGSHWLYGAVRDVTERKNNEKTLEEQAIRLTTINAELERFAYVAAHDLREPVRLVSNYLTLIEKSLGDDLSENTTKYIRFAVTGAKRMDQMVHDLLDYSCIGRTEDKFQKVSLTDVVNQSLDDLSMIIVGDKAQVVVAEGLPEVWGVDSELTRLFQNLIGNAIKYRHAERNPEIEIGSREEGADWIIWVRDNGMGIDPQHREQVFAIFHRLVPKDLYDGTGTGLAVCRRIIEHHGGRIWIEDAPDGGCVFMMTFPMADTPGSSISRA